MKEPTRQELLDRIRKRHGTPGLSSEMILDRVYVAALNAGYTDVIQAVQTARAEDARRHFDK